LRALLAASAILLLGCSVSFAQFASPTPNSDPMGATSPLGIPGATSPVGPVGIPLGATALSPGGLSPAPFDPTASNSPCRAGGASSGAYATVGYGTGLASTFDAAGMNTNPMGSGSPTSGPGFGTLGSSGFCGVGTSAGTASGTSSPFGGGIANPASGTGIPLGSSEIETPGISPIITSPVVSSLPMVGTLTPPVSSTLVIPGQPVSSSLLAQPTGPSRYYGFSTGAGSGGLATGSSAFQPLGISTAAGSGGLATASTNRQSFGYSTGAGPGGTPTGPTLR
jgi:hypothetical protein